MGIVVCSLLWVMQDLYHQPYDCTTLALVIKPPELEGFPLQKSMWGPGLRGLGSSGLGRLEFWSKYVWGVGFRATPSGL